MFNGVVELMKVIQEAKPKHYLLFTIMFLVLFAVLWGYEKWTASFKLTKLLKASDILLNVSKIEDIDKSRIQAINNAICTEIENIFIDIKESKSKPRGLIKLGYGILFWFVFGIIIWVSEYKKKKEYKAVYGSLVFGTIISIVGILLPAFMWPLSHLFIYPFFALILMLFLALSLATRSQRNSSNN